MKVLILVEHLMFYCIQLALLLTYMYNYLI